MIHTKLFKRIKKLDELYLAADKATWRFINHDCTTNRALAKLWNEQTKAWRKYRRYQKRPYQEIKR